MTSTTGSELFHCPSRDEVLSSVLSLLPRGRAWANNEGGPTAETTLYRFWEAFATVLQFFDARLCALRLEMFCATIGETRELWMGEFGLPDPCDPFPDLCTKVAAIGGTRCEYYSAIAARAGWTIACREAEPCGGMPDCAIADDAQADGSGVPITTLLIDVFLNESPAFTAPLETPPIADLLLADLQLACDPDVTALKCILDRVVHAHITVEYVLH